MNTEQREQELKEHRPGLAPIMQATVDRLRREGKRFDLFDVGQIDALLARLSAVERERDQWEQACYKAQEGDLAAVEARVEAAEQALREILNWSYDRELGVGTFVLLVQEAARAVLAPSQPEEK